MNTNTHCWYCGEPIKQTRDWHRFCGAECREKFHIDAHKAGYAIMKERAMLIRKDTMEERGER